MKSLIASVIILCSVILFTVFASIYTYRNLKNIQDEIDKIDPAHTTISEMYSIAVSASENFELVKSRLSTVINDNYINIIDGYLVDIKSACEAESNSDILIAKNRLISEIEQMRQFCTFSIDSIF